MQFLFSLFIALLAGGTVVVHDTFKEAPLPQSGEPATFYANQTNADLTHCFTSAIAKAEKSVLLVIYSLSDPQVIASLQNKSRQGVEVRVICDAEASLRDIENILGPNISTIRRFGPGLTHQKMLVIDGQQTWIGSANMTSDSLRMHGNLVVAFDHSPLAEQVTAKANSLRAEDRGPSFSFREFNIGGQSVELWFLPDNSDAPDRLIRLIRTAEKTLRVAMFTWTRPDLANAVVDAMRRGVDTEVVIDHYQGNGASSKIVKLLKRKGVKVALSKGAPLLHHKFLYIDDRTLVNGSANWTKAAFSKNDDCFIVIHDLNASQKEAMKALWKIILNESEPP